MRYRTRKDFRNVTSEGEGGINLDKSTLLCILYDGQIALNHFMGVIQVRSSKENQRLS